MTKLPVFSDIASCGLHYIVPIVVLVWFLMVERNSPAFSAYWATLFLLLILFTQKPLKAMFRKSGRVGERLREGVQDVADGLIIGARNMIGLAAAMGCGRHHCGRRNADRYWSVHR